MSSHFNQKKKSKLQHLLLCQINPSRQSLILQLSKTSIRINHSPLKTHITLINKCLNTKILRIKQSKWISTIRIHQILTKVATIIIKEVATIIIKEEATTTDKITVVEIRTMFQSLKTCTKTRVQMGKGRTKATSQKISHMKISHMKINNMDKIIMADKTMGTITSSKLSTCQFRITLLISQTKTLWAWTSNKTGVLETYTTWINRLLSM